MAKAVGLTEETLMLSISPPEVNGLFDYVNVMPVSHCGVLGAGPRRPDVVKLNQFHLEPRHLSLVILLVP